MATAQERMGIEEGMRFFPRRGEGKQEGMAMVTKHVGDQVCVCHQGWLAPHFEWYPAYGIIVSSRHSKQSRAYTCFPLLLSIFELLVSMRRYLY